MFSPRVQYEYQHITHVRIRTMAWWRWASGAVGVRATMELNGVRRDSRRPAQCINDFDQLILILLCVPSRAVRLAARPDTHNWPSFIKRATQCSATEYRIYDLNILNISELFTRALSPDIIYTSRFVNVGNVNKRICGRNDKCMRSGAPPPGEGKGVGEGEGQQRTFV